MVRLDGVLAKDEARSRSLVLSGAWGSSFFSHPLDAPTPSAGGRAMNLMGKEPAGQKQPKERFTPKERAYFRWLHTWDMGHGQCALSARWDIELAHTSTVAQGKGMSLKGPLRHIIPLSKPLHHVEERTRDTFWPAVGFPGNTRFDWSERLFEIFEAGDDPRALFADMQAKANREFMAAILRNAA